VIDLEAAAKLLDFGRRIGAGRRADEQLAGAVAIHNLLVRERVAYLADEVGMGKTYVALGALALFRHFQPNFRVCVIAPRENIQRKWQKELANFAAHNVRFADLRVSSIDRRPARALVDCPNLLSFARETSLDPHRDFFLRMSSFSLGLTDDPASWRKLQAEVKRELPWAPAEAFDLRGGTRGKERFKESVATAIGCTLPTFDLVIVDEAHNLKHGFESHASRNRLLGRVFGRADDVDPKLFPSYGRRAERVLFLSATPLEETYEHLWNQLDVFGLAGAFDDLRRSDLDEDAKKEVARRFLVRRVTELHAHDRTLTKNQYRREWRRGGVATHDEPIEVRDPRQRLVVALVQKKVAELLGSDRFNHSFQIGMLASFESFLETARLKRDPDERLFDDADQTDDALEREGIDVHDLNRLAKSHRTKFGVDLPHPKMDAVVDALADAWVTGRKALVFVRRVASVTELARKLDDRYDAWLLGYLHERLPAGLHVDFAAVVETYRREKAAADEQRRRRLTRDGGDGDDALDHGGTDTFFAWFFRGTGPEGFVSGATFQDRFRSQSGTLATFFARHHVAELLSVEPEETLEALATATRLELDVLRERHREVAASFLSDAKTVESAPRFEAAQAAALELLAEHADEPLRTRALVLLRDRYRAARRPHGTVRKDAPDVIAALTQRTFFSELRRPEWTALREALWPDLAEAIDSEGLSAELRARELRAELLSATARLGHASVDLFLSLVADRRSLRTMRATRVDDELAGDQGARRIRDFLAMLERQRQARAEGRNGFGAFDELRALSENHELVVDTNLPEAKDAPLAELPTIAARLLRRQQPCGGMAGQINGTLVRQFRMPGYPLVLVTTDLLQEGEDLHTFCSTVIHYGISWTPSAMEQRIGRVDRVRSATDRRLSSLTRPPKGDELLQVQFPYLEDTVEVLQVERVLERMNTFLRLMHEGLTATASDEKKIDVSRAMLDGRRSVEAITAPLRSAFPVPEELTRGSTTELPVDEAFARSVGERFANLRRNVALGGFPIAWEEAPRPEAAFGTATLADGRQQPFTLLLRSDGGHPVVRCISPVGRVIPEGRAEELAQHGARIEGRVGAILTRDPGSYDLTVEDDVALADAAHDAARVGLLLARVLPSADDLERTVFGAERDAELAVFKDDLKKETERG
jgi:hypothetical protein